ncbi:hypothetical protein GBA52_023998 [Prunus armeniaca]|nr:hypothetical protein GBA52_023998 [Prunus armeniaca]
MAMKMMLCNTFFFSLHNPIEPISMAGRNKDILNNQKLFNLQVLGLYLFFMLNTKASWKQTGMKKLKLTSKCHSIMFWN